MTVVATVQANRSRVHEFWSVAVPGLTYATEGDFFAGGFLTGGNAEGDIVFCLKMSLATLASATDKLLTVGVVDELSAGCLPRAHAEGEPAGSG